MFGGVAPVAVTAHKLLNSSKGVVRNWDTDPYVETNGRDEVVLSRLRLGHSYLTHSYLLKGEPPPECVTCNCRLTISHILVDCIEYDFFRLILFENNFTLTDIFNNVSPNKIISFIKTAGLYNTL